MKQYTAKNLTQPLMLALADGRTASVCASLKQNMAVLTVTLPYHVACGLGERFDGLNQKGRTVTVRVEEQFCNQGSHSYCVSPFFVTDTGFSLFVQTNAVTKFCFAENAVTVEMPADAPVLLESGRPDELVSRYVQQTGKMKLPPKWAFAPWISANHWNTQDRVEQQMSDLTRFDFPASTLVVEAWSDEATFYIFNGATYTPRKNGEAFCYEDFDFTHSTYWKNPKAMIEKLHRARIHLVLWQIPVYKKQGAEENLNIQNEYDRQDAMTRRLCVRKKDGTPYTIPEKHWFSGSMIPDFTNAETRKTWFSKRQYLLDIGVDGFKTDGGEFICGEDAVCSDGTTGAEQQNRYAESYTEAYAKAIGPGRVLFSRAGYIGQQTAPCHWGGDHQSTNEELKSVLSGGLSAAMSGIAFWGFDIAGFAGPMPTLDLYRRATMLACFSPIMQWHSEPDGGQFRELMPGGEGNNERSPWNMAARYHKPEFMDEMRFWHKLRMNLIPYLYTTALDCCEQNRPMMRPLLYDWPEDEAACAVQDEYLLGESLLIAPLMEENQVQRQLYLPEGIWYGLFSGICYKGKMSILSDAKEKFPVYLRAGHALPLFLAPEQAPGEYEGNAVDSGNSLRLLLAGQAGKARFRDEKENNFTLEWNGNDIHLVGIVQEKIQYRHMQ